MAAAQQDESALRVGFCTHPAMLEHDTGPYHPERPDRLIAISKALRAAGLLHTPDPFPDLQIDFGPLAPARSRLVELTAAPADEKWLQLVHRREYIERVRHVCRHNGVLDQGDTPCMHRSFEAALWSVGCALQCCDAVMNGQVQRAFAAVRPPGHHAEPHLPMGFCLFSNIAIAARYIQKCYGIERIAIVDFDVHHGNGTQAAFEHEATVHFTSLHQDPRTCYPRTGFAWEIGTGIGRGYTLNLPFNPGAEDADYLRVVDLRVVPELEEYQPQVLMISAGFDAHYAETLAEPQIRLTEEGYELLTRSLMAVAARHCQGRVISLLEGGYNLRSLGRSVVRHIMAMQE